MIDQMDEMNWEPLERPALCVRCKKYPTPSSICEACESKEKEDLWGALFVVGLFLVIFVIALLAYLR